MTKKEVENLKGKYLRVISNNTIIYVTEVQVFGEDFAIVGDELSGDGDIIGVIDGINEVVGVRDEDNYKLYDTIYEIVGKEEVEKLLTKSINFMRKKLHLG